MIPVITSTQSFTIPDRVIAGQTLTAYEAAYLQNLAQIRLRTLVAYWLDKKSMPPAEAQENLIHEVQSFSLAEVSDPTDPITAEALRIAKMLVRKRLAAEGLDIDDEILNRHAAEAAKIPIIRAKAEEIILIRRAKARESLTGR